MLTNGAANMAQLVFRGRKHPVYPTARQRVADVQQPVENKQPGKEKMPAPPGGQVLPPGKGRPGGKGRPLPRAKGNERFAERRVVTPIQRRMCIENLQSAQYQDEKAQGVEPVGDTH